MGSIILQGQTRGTNIIVPQSPGLTIQCGRAARGNLLFQFFDGDKFSCRVFVPHFEILQIQFKKSVLMKRLLPGLDPNHAVVLFHGYVLLV